MNIKLKRQILNKMREVSRWMPAKKECLDAAMTEDRNKFKCACCKRLYRQKSVQVDHIIPVICPEFGFPKDVDHKGDVVDQWTTYINRLFCDASNLQVLCKRCHKKKTTAENLIRKESRKNGTYKF